ncbi:hypothetical protein CYMTET_10306 [Cymbomonas tetramitiformis]|uniref:Uncharacterized protein n=1 Tax=Cymbomonas tetramitiformis TaxID=36881 RepID=A0AAE0GPK9_9CHLO|nr:hypothetical protein CYMTET_10306 [Cymbomonas tetramitiformis]
MLGLMIAANEASKEDKPDDDGNLKTISGKYISTEDTMSSVDLVDLAGVAPEDLRSLDNILLTTDTGSKRYYTITGFESFSTSHLELFSARGDRITIRDGSVEVLNSDGSTTAVARRRLLASNGDCQLRTGKYSMTDPWQAKQQHLDSDSDTDLSAKHHHLDSDSDPDTDSDTD